MVGIVALAGLFLTDGDWTLLTYRPLPPFLGVATSIVVFAVVRERRGAKPTGTLRVVATVGGALVITLIGVALYRPAVMDDTESRLEELLGIWSAGDEAAIDSYIDALRDWNEAVEGYRQAFAAVRAAETVEDVTAFQQAATESESRLDSLLVRLRTIAGEASNDDLANALRDLAGVYDDQLSGLQLVTRGQLQDDFNVLEEGDKRYKDSKRRARELFDERLRPIFERHEIEVDAFIRALEA